MTDSPEVLGGDVVLEVADRRPVITVDEAPGPHPGRHPFQHHQRCRRLRLLGDLALAAQGAHLLAQRVELVADVGELGLHGDCAEDVGYRGGLGRLLWIQAQDVVEPPLPVPTDAKRLRAGVLSQLLGRLGCQPDHSARQHAGLGGDGGCRADG